ncbi:unnamed protein product [Cuscuta epithymum]|uniref:GH10 domain-containing protein n=3 Tax=Cuscuta epithymum TaxID=186058 RepID=A0AAV0EZN3_9ASTE|nr:unnamed protein product [Cuscuta epithymum]
MSTKCLIFSLSFAALFLLSSKNNSMTSCGNNIILNHNFTEGLNSWHHNCCEAFLVPAGVENYVVVTNRKECWQGLEQDITNRVSIGSTYTVSAYVGVSGAIQVSSDVQATLKLEYRDSSTTYVFIGRKSVSKDCWEKLEGTFSLSSKPDRVVFYLEGPLPGVDLLIKSVVVTCSSSIKCKNSGSQSISSGEGIILNSIFEDGMNNWSGRGCKILLHDSMEDGKVRPVFGNVFARATERTHTWNGFQQEITGRALRKLAYEVLAKVRLYGSNVTSSAVRATLWVQMADLREEYIGIATVQTTDKEWSQLQGKFLLNGFPSKVIIFLEGPPPGTDILLNTLTVKRAAKVLQSPPPVIENVDFGINIITNTNLNNDTNGWFPLGNCTLTVAIGSPLIIPPAARDSLGAHPQLSGRYLLVGNRTETWMGPAQIITHKVKAYLTYQVSAWVRIGKAASGAQSVNVALDVDGQWVNRGQVEIDDDNKWHEICGSFRIEKEAAKVKVCVQGPAPGVNLMVAALQIFRVDRKARYDHLRGETDKIRKRDVILRISGSESFLGTAVNVRQIQNSFPFGSCISRGNIDNEEYRDFFLGNFNWAVFGNELKWYSTEPQQGNINYNDADELLDFCMRNNIPVRGHCIFWEVEDVVQPWVRGLEKNDLSIAIKARLTSLLTRYKGKFKHYDVNNEMMHGSFYQDRLGKETLASMFKAANKIDPSALLFVNDYHVEDGCDARSCPEKYIDHILELQERGAPVGGIGIQGHIDCPIGPIIRHALNKLGILGLPIWFTEIDFFSKNEYIRADDLEVMLRECYAHPSVEGIMLWGFWELFMSRENSHLVNAEGDLNEAGKRYVALKREWMSHCHGNFNQQGEFFFRGFYGSYEVEVIGRSKVFTKTFVVDKGEDVLIISIDA